MSDEARPWDAYASKKDDIEKVIVTDLRGEVEHVDEDQAESDQENNPSRDNVLNIVITDDDTFAHDDDDYRGDEERDPAHHDEHGGGQVDGEDEGAQGPRQTDLKSIGAVVTCKRFMGEIKTF